MELKCATMTCSRMRDGNAMSGPLPSLSTLGHNPIGPTEVARPLASDVCVDVPSGGSLQLLCHIPSLVACNSKARRHSEGRVGYMVDVSVCTCYSLSSPLFTQVTAGEFLADKAYVTRGEAKK